MRENETGTARPDDTVDSTPIEGTAPEPEQPPAPVKRTRRRSTAAAQAPAPAASLDEAAASDAQPAESAAGEAPAEAAGEPEVAEKPKRRAARRRTTKAAPEAQEALPVSTELPPAAEALAEAPTAVEVTEAAEEPTAVADETSLISSLAPQLSHIDEVRTEVERATAPAALNPFAIFVAPEEVTVPAAAPKRDDPVVDEQAASSEADSDSDSDDGDDDSDDDGDSGSRRRRRGRRGRGKKAGDDSDDASTGDDDAPRSGRSASKDKNEQGSASEKSSNGSGNGEKDDSSAQTDGSAKDDDSDDSESGSRRRRRRRRRGGDDNDSDSGAGSSSSSGSSSSDRVRGVTGSVRLEAKRQRRKEGRDHGRRRAPILTEAEFLARRESVTRRMVVRQQGERTQIAVLEDDVLVEHYVTLASEQSFAGGVYYGRVQNVLPSMEAAFVDIGKKRNAVLYAGEVNWDAAGLEGKQRNIEQALKSGDKVLVQVTKDPIGHKGARLTSQVSLPGRYLVYVPGGSMTGISRKLPEGERQRLKDILRKIVPDEAGVIIRTAAEGASEEELTRDVNRLKAQWEVIEQKVADSKTKAPSVLYEEPDLAIRVVRDLFNEDFSEMLISGADAWDTISAYMQHVAPDLVERIKKYDDDPDVFAANRIDEQLSKALDRKVWLPSGGSLVIDHTEAMTVIDVNTGKFTGTGGNLEQTVTKNNLEAAEEIVRQLRLRDVGGIVVIDFIDMLLESNRELVLRRLTECLGRDRTKHQVAEVTSLGLVQMTRKRVGQGLLDAFSEPCPHCEGRGLIVHSEPVEKKTASTSHEPQGGKRGRSRRGGDRESDAARAEQQRRDSTNQLSAIAAAISKKGENDAAGSEQPAAPTSAETPQPATPTESPVTEAPHPDAQSGERRPTARRRRAARRPAGPPTAVTETAE